MKGFVFDAGAFSALERRAPLMLGILDEALHGRIEVVLPRTVIAQVWRGAPRQANINRLISAGLAREPGHHRRADRPARSDDRCHDRPDLAPDIVDVHVALAAAERGHAVLTSDDADIAHVDGDLVLVHV